MQVNFAAFMSMMLGSLPKRYQKKPRKSGAKYYKERNFDPAPPATPKLMRSIQPRISMTHRALSERGVPRRKDGNRLGLRRRIEMAGLQSAFLLTSGE